MPRATSSARSKARFVQKWVSVRALGGFSILLALGCGAGDAGRVRPEPAVARTLPAQRAFRYIALAWNGADASQRRNLKGRLRRFLELYPDEPRARTARTYLARIYASEQQWIAAEALVKPLLEGPAGVEHDLAEVVAAELDLEQHRPDAARRRLQRLERKLVDSEARSYYGQVATRTAIALRAWPLAISTLDSWLVDNAAERQERDQHLALALLEKLPYAALEHGLRQLDSATPKNSSPNPERLWLRNQLRQRLVAHAIDTDDSSLARRLLDADRRKKSAATDDVALSKLAEASGAVARIVGRSLGFVTSLGSAAARSRSTATLAGLSAGLAADSDEPIRLLVRDDAGSAANTALALQRLASEGASLLVAGVDAESSLEAQTFAKHSEIPVLLLEDPNFDELPSTAFVLGANENAVRDVLSRALSEHGWSTATTLEATSALCQAPFGAELAPADASRDGRRATTAPAFVLLGGPACSRAVLERYASRAWLFVLGLDSAHLLPELASTPPRNRDARAQFAAVTTDGFLSGPAPRSSWYRALGEDAARLAKIALAHFPDEALVEGSEAVSRWHQRATTQLGAASVELSTAGAHGFSKERRVPRQFRLTFEPSKSHAKNAAP